MEAFNKALEYTPESDELLKHLVFYSKAVFLESIGKSEDSLPLIDEAIKYRPSCDTSWSFKGYLLLNLDRIPEAIGCIERALELDDKFFLTWYNKAIALSSLGPEHFEEVLKCYNKVIELQPSNYYLSIAYFNKGVVLQKMNRCESALKAFEEFLKYDPNYPCGWCNKGITLNRLDRDYEALESFEKCFSLDFSNTMAENCAKIYLNYAIVLANLERIDESEEMVRKSLSLDPKYEEAQQFLEEIRKIRDKT